jgi:uncharacterized protein with GYD domain
MGTYVLLTKLSPESASSPKKLLDLAAHVRERVQTDCENVEWLANYALLGPYDYLDVFNAPDDLMASKVAMIVRSFGHATTETWGAIPWARFQETLETSGEPAGGGVWSRVRESVLGERQSH